MFPIFLFAQDPSTPSNDTATPAIAPPSGQFEKQAAETIGQVLPTGSPEWLQALVFYGIPYAIGAVKVFIILFIAWIIAGIASRLITKALTKARLDETLSRFFAKLARWMILLLGLLACLSIFGVETTSFAAVIGAAGLAIGLAFQGTLSNFASGVMLLIFRPFKVGQFVKVGGEAGIIYEIDLFTTSMDTFDNRRIIIPNGSIFTSTIENVSHHPKRRIDLNVGTSYDADIDRTRQIFVSIIESLPNKLDDPEFQVVLMDLGPSSIDWQLRIWAKADVFWSVREELIRNVKYALDRENIGIPFPQMEIHVARDQ